MKKRKPRIVTLQHGKEFVVNGAKCRAFKDGKHYKLRVKDTKKK